MNTSAAVARDEQLIASTPVDSAGRGRRSLRREAVLLIALACLVAAVALFGLAFPELLAAAIAVAVLAVIVGLDWLLPSGELRSMSGRHGTR
jgi:hypothetical protein